MKISNLLTSSALACLLLLGACATLVPTPGSSNTLVQAQEAASTIMVAASAAAITYEAASTTTPAEAGRVKTDVIMAVQLVEAFEAVPAGASGKIEAEAALNAIESILTDLPTQSVQALEIETAIAVINVFISNLQPVPAPITS